MSEHWDNAPGDRSEARAGGGPHTGATDERTFVGSRANVQRALQRAKATLTASRERLARSRRTLAASGERVALPSAQPAERATSRASIKARARRLRDEGLSPERVLVDVKEAIHECLSPTLGPNRVRAVVDNAVRWAVEAYYENRTRRKAT